MPFQYLAPPTMSISLRPLTSRTPLPALSIPILYLALIITLALPIGRYRALLAVPFVIHTYLLLNFTTGSLVSDYAIGSAIAQLCFKFLDFVVFSDAEREFQLLSGKEGEVLGHEQEVLEQKKAAGNESTSAYLNKIKKRITWADGLAFTARGIGWSWEVKNVPSHPSFETTQKKLYAILKFFFHNIIYKDLSNPTFTILTLVRALRFYILIRIRTAILTAYPAHMFTEQHVTVQTVLCFVYGAQIMFALELSYALAAAVTVGMRICEPKEWPPAFGKWEDAFTLRRFWGRIWHQMERRVSLPFPVHHLILTTPS